jgi:long-chain fatty acid transport protein
MKTIFKLFIFFFSLTVFAQVGHLMQGVGAVNMSMGGAATAQPLDINGALQWNPAAISTFKGKTLSINIGAFSGSPELSSKLPAGMLGPGAPAVSGTTKDELEVSPMPSIAYVWGKADSKHTYGLSAFGISGFGVKFPEETNNPMSPAFNPMINSNPINYPQAARGFGLLRSEYMLLQVGFSYAYEISKKVSIGFTPTINYANLQLGPNPTANPSMAGYPYTDKTPAFGYGGQVGIFYQGDSGLKLGANYKSPQYFTDLKFKNTYLDNTKSENSFNMNYPAVYSLGAGYTTNDFDFALDFRQVEYAKTAGFEEYGWTQFGSVKGFGWKDIQVLSMGVQYKGINKLPLRVGYTYSSNPIKPELAFFSSPATAIIKNAYQFGFGYEFSDKLTLNGVYHHGDSNGSTAGPMYNPMMAGPTNPLGAIPGSEVSYKMTTDLLMIGFSYKLN